MTSTGRPVGIAPIVLLATLILSVALVAVGCSDSDSISQSEMDEAIAEALAGLPPPGISAAEVEAAIESAIEEMPSPQSMTDAELRTAIREVVESVVTAGASSHRSGDDAASDPEGEHEAAPPKSNPMAYTRWFVDAAIARYDADGLASALAHYNDPDSVDEQWYVFIVDRNAEVIGHYDPQRLGLNLLGFAGTDINGYKFGPEMLAADETGRWVPYVYVNPAEGTLDNESAFELKNAWVVRHDGLLFGSGWYINSDEFLPALISEASEHFRAGGLEAILAFYNDPYGISAGLIPTVEYYNRTETLDGYFSGFVAAPDGDILAHFDSSLIGTDIEDLLGPAVRKATAEGIWLTAVDNPADVAGPESMRIWVVDVNGTLIGGGWYND